MVIDADIHVTRDSIANLRERLPERYRQRERFQNADEHDRALFGTLGKHDLSAEEHIVDMEQEGIDVQVLFPTGLLNYGSTRQPDLAVALCRVYNDWLREFCQADPRRFKGVALVPCQDMREATRELNRAVTDLGMVAAMVPTYVYPGKDLGSHEFDELYGEAQRLGVPIAVHRVSGSGAVGFERFTNFTALHACVPMFELATAVTNMTIGGVFDRFPTLKVAFLEAGIGWVPWLVENLDEHVELRHPEVPHLKAKPSEYLSSGRAWFSFEPDEEAVPEVAALLGEQSLLFSSDYPHWDWVAGGVRLVQGRADMSDSLKQAVLTTNAANCYGLSAGVPA
jgi:uncharacterized protein